MRTCRALRGPAKGTKAVFCLTPFRGFTAFRSACRCPGLTAACPPPIQTAFPESSVKPRGGSTTEPPGKAAKKPGLSSSIGGEAHTKHLLSMGMGHGHAPESTGGRTWTWNGVSRRHSASRGWKKRPGSCKVSRMLAGCPCNLQRTTTLGYQHPNSGKLHPHFCMRQTFGLVEAAWVGL